LGQNPKFPAGKFPNIVRIWTIGNFPAGQFPKKLPFWAKILNSRPENFRISGSKSQNIMFLLDFRRFLDGIIRSTMKNPYFTQPKPY
jgi:hypothetical protein